MLKKKQSVSVNFIHAAFSCMSPYDDLVMKALVWLCMFWFRVIWYGAEPSSLALHMRTQYNPTHI